MFNLLQKRCLVGDDFEVKFIDAQKNLGEKLYDVLIENLYITQSKLDNDKLNIFELYKTYNDKISMILSKPIKFHVKSNIKTINCVGIPSHISIL